MQAPSRSGARTACPPAPAFRRGVLSLLEEVGSDATLQVLVERPPRSLDAARRVAAEHWAFADECAGLGLRDIQAIAAHIVNAPIWIFWWTDRQSEGSDLDVAARPAPGLNTCLFSSVADRLAYRRTFSAFSGCSLRKACPVASLGCWPGSGDVPDAVTVVVSGRSARTARDLGGQAAGDQAA